MTGRALNWIGPGRHNLPLEVKCTGTVIWSWPKSQCRRALSVNVVGGLKPKASVTISGTDANGGLRSRAVTLVTAAASRRGYMEVMKIILTTIAFLCAYAACIVQMPGISHAFF